MISKVAVDKERCKGCQYCVVYCPKHCFDMSKDLNKHGVNYAQFVRKNDCITCGLCEVVCPDVCIVVYKNIKDEVYKKLGSKISDFLDGKKELKEREEEHVQADERE